MLTIGFPCREYTTFERIIRISLTFNYNKTNIAFYFIIYINIQEVINRLTIKDKQHYQSYKAHKSHILFFIEQYFSKTIKGLR